MDFDVSAEQQQRLNVIDEIVASCGGVERARSLVGAGVHDAGLDDKLSGSDILDGAGPLERVLIADRLSELGVASAFGLRAVVTSGLDGVPDGPVAVLDPNRVGPVRFASIARSILVVGDDEVRVLDVTPDPRREIRSSFGYPYGRVPDDFRTAGRALDVAPATVRRMWRLALAAEISGTAAGGIAHTAHHLSERAQFGRPLSSFQALRHRLAELAVSAEAGRWMTREAAWSGDERASLRAGWYATGTAAQLAPELTQMCGARSFAIDFGLHVFTMRLEGLRLEMGARDHLALALAASPSI